MNGSDPGHAQTIAFTSLAMFQVFNSLNCRSRTKSLFQLGPLTNRFLVGAIAISVFLQVLANRVPFLRTVLGTEPLSLAQWGLIVLVSSSVFVADELRKLVTNHSRRLSRPNWQAHGYRFIWGVGPA
jgi:Ca2+-transporting ATPase